MASCERPGNYTLSGKHLLKRHWTFETLELLNHIWAPCWVMRARWLNLQCVFLMIDAPGGDSFPVTYARSSEENGNSGNQQQFNNIWLSNTARSSFGEKWAVGDVIKLNKLGMSPAARSEQETAMSWQELIKDVTVSTCRPLGMPHDQQPSSTESAIESSRWHSAFCTACKTMKVQSGC